MHAKKIFTLAIIASYLYLLFYLYFDFDKQDIFPSKAITIVVHSKPGSAIDLMSRKIAELSKKYSKQAFVVENHPGTQGIVAMQYVIDKKADGYTLLGVTKSFISTLLVNKSDVSISDFIFVANMISDPEAIISNKENQFHSIKDIIEQARRLKGKQVWIGPGTGSRDHLMAIKTWEVLGIKAQWVDYKSGPQAILAMLRNEAPVYVGNPADIAGKPQLEIIAIAAPKRLEHLPETPTFLESGYELNEYMWRGYALKKGTPPQAVKYISNILHKISQDPEWIQYCEDIYSFADYKNADAFSQQVQREKTETVAYLKSVGLLDSYVKKGVVPLWLAAVILALAVCLFLLIILKFDYHKINYNLILSGFFMWIALFFYYQTMLFDIPEKLNVTSPAMIPRLWSLGLIVFVIWNIVNELKGKNKPAETGNIKLVLKILLLLVIYLISIPTIGYYISTPVFLLGSMYVLGYRKWEIMLINAFGFVLFSYLVFDILLKIELPLGNI